MHAERLVRRTGRKRPFLAGASFLVVVGFLWVADVVAADPNVEAVRAVAIDTVKLEHTFGIPDASHPKFTQADVPRLHVQANEFAKSHYVGTLLATRIGNFLNVVDAMESGELTLVDGGVDGVSFLSTDVDADTAVVVFRATVWSSVITRDGSKASPSSTNVWTVKLAKVGPGWFVSSVDSDFQG